jgi:hypothetical protein
LWSLFSEKRWVHVRGLRRRLRIPKKPPPYFGFRFDGLEQNLVLVPDWIVRQRMLLAIIVGPQSGYSERDGGKSQHSNKDEQRSEHEREDTPTIESPSIKFSIT